MSALRRHHLRLSWFLFAAVIFAASSAQSQPSDSACTSPEDCYRAAFGKQPSAPDTASQFAARLQRLTELRERYPDTPWSARAGLATGLLLLERNPAESLPYFRAAQRDLPVIEDYARLWMGEALLKMGDARDAAVQIERIPEAVPDTLLGVRVAYRAGESWYKAGHCDKAVELLAKAVLFGSQDPAAPGALLMVAECHSKEKRPVEAQAAWKQLWIRYPQTQEAKEAERRLTQAMGAAWRPTPDDSYNRALAFLNLALYEEAVADLQKFLAGTSPDARRGEARLKLGTALVRLKRYEQARQVFKDLAGGAGSESDEATVWLARVYLRLNDGERLLALASSAPRLTLSLEQKATIQLLLGIWQDDQGQYDQALATYRKVLQLGEASGQRAEALWRIGWIHYRTGRYGQAVDSFRDILKGKDDPQAAPKALYWAGRALDQSNDRQASDLHGQLCRQYPLTYYCQLAQLRSAASPSMPASANGLPSGGGPGEDSRTSVLRDAHYLRAVELRLLGMDQEAAREWVSLPERYVRDRAALAELSTLLSQAGATHHALRLVRLYFREGLERGGEAVPPALWSVAYPTAYLPAIRAQAGSGVDPYLVAAIIREESQYDPRALSRVGAVGLMQVMPVTAQQVAKKQGLPDVGRDDLFDQDVNIRVGTRYVEQLLQQFNGNIMHTVAAYNAGPQAVTGWIAKANGRDADEWVELIPYQETRQYVKRVLRSYREYHRLGGSACALRFLDKAC
ncbi:MAG: transglycosylase SLT domain-containing protein [Nitrospiraceae bacterium]